MWRVLIVGAEGRTKSALRQGLQAYGYAVVCARSVALGARFVRDVHLAILAVGPERAGSGDVDAALSALGARVPVMVVPERREGSVERIDRRFEQLRFADVEADFERYRATKGGAELQLSVREFDLLRYLAERSDRVVSRGELLRAVWDADGRTQTRTVDMHVAKLRRKLDGGRGSPSSILTVHGIGYRFVG